LLFFTIDAFLVYQIVKQLLAWDTGRPIYLILASASAALLFATKETAFITLGTMAMACASVWVWRGVLNSQFWRRSYMQAIIGVHVVAAFALLISRQTLADAYKALTDSFFSSFRPPEPFVFYSIFILLVV